ncbi:MAG: wax ester/triacylglycerol synthase domain-containing protein, partial [Candidatus Binatia bacterium]
MNASSEEIIREPPRRRPQRMGPSDAVFWYGEAALPVFRPIIGGLYVLDGPIDTERMNAAVGGALGSISRLRERALDAPLHLGLPEWVDDPHFDRTYHVRHLSLSAGSGIRELLDLTATFLAVPLDRERPLWELYCIDGLDGDCSAIFLKMHHAMVDGVGAIALLEALTQVTRDQPPPEWPAETPARPMPSLTERLVQLARYNALESVKLAVHAAGMPMRIAREPVGYVTELLSTVRGAVGVLGDALTPMVRDPLARSAGGLSRRMDIVSISICRLQAIK